MALNFVPDEPKPSPRLIEHDATVVRLDRKGLLYFSRLAPRVFGGRRLVVLEFDKNSHALKFTAGSGPRRRNH